MTKLTLPILRPAWIVAVVIPLQLSLVVRGHTIQLVWVYVTPVITILVAVQVVSHQVILPLTFSVTCVIQQMVGRRPSSFIALKGTTRVIIEEIQGVPAVMAIA